MSDHPLSSYEAPEPRRICTKCGASSTRAEGMTSWGRNAVCKPCRQKANTDYIRKKRSEHPELIRQMNLWRMYKMTPDEYEALRTLQENRCAICGIHEDDVDRTKLGGRPRKDGTASTRFALAVDHCHDRDAVRGLLCLDCNVGISKFSDDGDRLRAAAAYVEREPVMRIDRNRVRERAKRGSKRLGEGQEGMPSL